MQHKITNVTHDVYGWTATCSCGKWAGVASSERKLKTQHEQHVAEYRAPRRTV